MDNTSEIICCTFQTEKNNSRGPQILRLPKLVLEQATEADADAIASLHLLSFDCNVLLHAQFPTPESMKGLHTFLSKDAVRDLQDPGKALMVMRDTETRQIVSFAKWDLPGPPRPHVDTEWSEDCQQQYLDEYYEKADAARKRVVGDELCYCMIHHSFFDITPLLLLCQEICFYKCLIDSVSRTFPSTLSKSPGIRTHVC